MVIKLEEMLKVNFPKCHPIGWNCVPGFSLYLYVFIPFYVPIADLDVKIVYCHHHKQVR